VTAFLLEPEIAAAMVNFRYRSTMAAPTQIELEMLQRLFVRQVNPQEYKGFEHLEGVFQRIKAKDLDL
jgi:hypothetical protein